MQKGDEMETRDGLVVGRMEVDEGMQENCEM